MKKARKNNGTKEHICSVHSECNHVVKYQQQKWVHRQVHDGCRLYCKTWQTGKHQ